MNVLFVCSARSWGGNERWVSMAMEALRPDHRVLLACRRGEMAARFGETDLTVGLPFRSVLDIPTYAGLARMVRDERVDTVVSTKRKENLICALLRVFLRFGHVVRLGIVRRLPRPSLRRWVFRRGCDAVLVNAGAIADELVRCGLERDRVRVVRNGVPEMEPAPRRKDGRLRVVCVGSLIPRKGQAVLLEAVSLLPRELRGRVEVVLAGEGPEEEALREMSTRLCPDARVAFAGFVPDVRRLEGESDLFVLLSRNEGIPNAALEAMALGVPVMLTAAGWSAELVTDGVDGLLVPPDPARVAERMAGLALDPRLRRRLGDAGRERVRSCFSLEGMRKGLVELLEEVTRGPGP